MAMAEDWYKSEEFIKKLEDFHQKRARYPDMTAVNKVKEDILDKMGDKMKSLSRWRIKKLEYTGSVYEKLKIDQPDEFDIMVVVQVKNVKVLPCSKPGFRNLAAGPDNDVGDKVINEQGHVSSTKFSSQFFSVVDKSVKELHLVGKVKPRLHGPAIQIDVTDGGLKFSIDVVPTLEIDGQLYVAKPFKGDSHSWRVSTSLKEKARLAAIDSDQGHRRKCVRILKAMREKEAGFKTLQSFHYKTALFHIADKQKSWQRKELGSRLMDLLAFLQESLEKHHLPHYFFPQLNLFESLSPAACSNLASRIKRLRRNQVEFYKVISV